MYQPVTELVGVDNKKSQKLLILEIEFETHGIFDMGEIQKNACFQQKIMSLFSEMPN